MRWSRGLDQLLRLDVEEESEEKTSSDTSRNRKGSYWREVHRKSSRIVILVKNISFCVKREKALFGHLCLLCYTRRRGPIKHQEPTDIAQTPHMSSSDPPLFCHCATV